MALSEDYRPLLRTNALDLTAYTRELLISTPNNSPVAPILRNILRADPEYRHCDGVDGHHSPDRVSVWRNGPEPVYLCRYHSEHALDEYFIELRKLGIL